jgi:hypothetical protein
MLPKHMPTLEGKEAKAFIEQDAKPLSSEQKAFLKECQRVYKDKPIK